ncbi:MAG: hypothetical protein NVS9B4_04440 [Candidatus Acidiferrum sp.]
MNVRKRWLRVTECSNIPLREGRAIKVAGLDIAIFNLGDRFLAIDNRCPHKGGPLADGIISGTTVVCPLHAWRANLETGTVMQSGLERACLTTFPIRLVDGVLLLELPAESAGELDAPDRRPGQCMDGQSTAWIEESAIGTTGVM